MNQQIQHILDGAMTAKQVRNALADMDDDAKVVFVCGYGDHGRTQQALPVTEIIDGLSDADLRETSYSQSGIALTRTAEEGQTEEVGTTPIILLRS